MIKQQKVKIHKVLFKTKPILDFLEVARKIKVKRKMNVLKAREFMEKNYERA